MTDNVRQTIPQTMCLGMMAKYWHVGTVKTRLAQSIGHAAAADIHKAFTLHLAGELAATETNADRQSRYIFASPDDACQTMQQDVGATWTIVPQGDGDLGARMQRALARLLATQKPHTRQTAMLIGADLPTLGSAEIAQAASLFQSNDVVLGPALDGGYYLIGLAGPWRSAYESLFAGIPWSTASVLTQTMSQIDKHRLSCGLLSKQEDIDNLESLQRLLQSGRLTPHLRSTIENLIPANHLAH